MSVMPQADLGCAGQNGRTRRLNTVRLQDALAQPWRNGGGITRELLAWSAPQGSERQGHDAAAGSWDLRVSVADITQDGPFSTFPGISRCFAVLEGAGVVLTLRGHDQNLTPDSEPLAFDGAEAPGCRLIGGPTRDLNLMVQHRAGRAWMQRAKAGQRGPLDTTWPWYGLYTHDPARLDTADGRIELPAGTLAWWDAGAERNRAPALNSAWCLVDGTQAWWLGLQVVNSASPANKSL